MTFHIYCDVLNEIQAQNRAQNKPYNSTRIVVGKCDCDDVEEAILGARLALKRNATKAEEIDENTLILFNKKGQKAMFCNFVAGVI